MCGILGFASKQSIQREVFRQALRTLSARGPDDEGVYEDVASDGTQILLGNRRLAILDLTAAGHQPMSDPGGNFTITFNGEIYNYHELREKLRRCGYQFSSDSDTEVLLYGYMHYGTKIVEKLEGMFAFAIYDHRKQEMFCGRDHFGKKPFYYFYDPAHQTFAFASELKALKTLQGGFVINNLAIAQFLVYGYIPSPNSIYQEVKKLPPATAIIFDLVTGKIKRKWRFWRLEEIKLNRQIGQKEAVDQLDLLLNRAVERRLVADVSLGSFLSGGIDSSLITAVAAQHSSNLDTFTVIYDDAEISEAKFARATTHHLNIHPHLFRFADEDAQATLEKVLDYMDEPFADAAIIPTVFLSQKTCEHVTVALSGDGGDELFGGYPKYKAQLIAEKLNKWRMKKLLAKLTRLAPVVSFASQVSTFFPHGREQILDKFLQGLAHDLPVRHFYWGNGGILPSEQSFSRLQAPPPPPTNGSVCRWGSLAALEEKVFLEAYRYTDLFQSDDLGNLLLFLDLMLQLPDGYLAKVDRASMMHSLEVRTPFLEKELVAFVFSLPSSKKFDLFRSKKLLKKLALGYLPGTVIKRPKKGFGVPLNRWLRTIFRQRVEKCFQGAIRHPTGVFELAETQKMWQEFLAGHDGYGTKIWRLFILSEFLLRENQSY